MYFFLKSCLNKTMTALADTINIYVLSSFVKNVSKYFKAKIKWTYLDWLTEKFILLLRRFCQNKCHRCNGTHRFLQMNSSTYILTQHLFDPVSMILGRPRPKVQNLGGADELQYFLVQVVGRNNFYEEHNKVCISQQRLQVATIRLSTQDRKSMYSKAGVKDSNNFNLHVCSSINLSLSTNSSYITIEF